ncbi:MAG: DUF429 domain-containing protein [Pseudomonadota bacterium]
MTVWVAGVDGCPTGWVVVLRPLDDPAAARVQHVATFPDILALPEQPAVIAIDIPIGLPDSVTTGGRDADIQARRVLGKRQSAVFAMPSRAAVFAGSYPDSCAAALASSDPPRKISKQAYNLFPKVREVDAAMTTALQDRVFEVHPEVAFWALNDEEPLATAKKVKSRPNPEGLAQRRALLSSPVAGFAPAFLAADHLPKRIAGADDVLDATVNAHVAARIYRGEARRFPPEPGIDARGLRMEIWG